jgi:hypothetical protein
MIRNSEDSTHATYESFSLPSRVERRCRDVLFQCPLVHPLRDQGKAFLKKARRGYTDEWNYVLVTEVHP